MINIGHLTTGNFTNAGIMLVSTGIAARALGPADYGVLILTLSFGRMIERICRFESWQPLIRFAAEMEGKAEPRAFARLFAFGLLFDVGAAFVAAMLTCSLAVLAGPIFGLSGERIGLVVIYSVALLVNYTGMPTAALRLAGRFRTIAYSQFAGNILRLGLAAWCWVAGAGLYGFIVVWTACQIVGAAIFFVLALRALAAQGIPNPLRVPLSAFRGGIPGFLGFALSTNLSMTLRTLTSEADSLLVGALAGPSSAGFYYLAKRFAKVAQQVGAQVQAVLYPDVARMWVKGNIARFRATTLHVQAAMAAVGITLLIGAWLAGGAVIDLGLGEAYRAAYPLLLTQCVAVIFTMHAAPSRSALLAMNRPQAVLIISACGVALFFATSIALIPRMGPIGANLGQIALAIAIAVPMDVLWLRAAKRAERAIGH